jgi:YhcH/YjgK/YiaL family protein
MIIGDLTHWDSEKDAFAPIFHQVVDYLRGMDLEHAEPGRYEIQGDSLFLLVQELQTVTADQRKSERHARYIDFQYLIRGEELIVVARTSTGNAVAVEDNLEERDYALFNKVDNEMDVWLKPGMFAVFFPNDLHRPACSQTGATSIKKAVVKMDRRLLFNL